MRIGRHYLELDDESVCHYRRVRGAGRGKPIILLHQVSSSSRMFERIMPKLVDSGFDPIAPDLPGFGNSDSVLPVSIERHGRWLASFIRAVGVRRPLRLVGHHTGAGVAVEYAVTRPDEVLSLVLVGVPHFLDEDERTARWEAKKISSLEPAFDGSHLAHEWNRLGELSPTTSLDLRHRELTDTLLARDYQGTYRALWEWSREVRLPEVGCPTTVVAGTRDFGLYHAQAAAASLIPRANLIEVEGGGVFMFDEHADRIADIIVHGAV